VFGLEIETQGTFKDTLSKCGYGEQVVAALWKWYDFAEKKGVASF
jgi:hypothetical protein